MKFFVIFSLLWLSLFSNISAAELLYPNAPIEASQFNFLIGKWDCNLFIYDNEGNEQEPVKCSWDAEYKFNKRMISDDFAILSAEGIFLYSGTTLRTYSIKDKRWEFTYLASNVPVRWNPWHGKMIDDEMRMPVSGIDDVGEYIGNAKFFNIKENSFKWQLEKSYDQGKTWLFSARMEIKRR